MLKRLDGDTIILSRLNLSQQPEIMKLQSRCYEMLTAGEEMPSKAAKSVERQLEELQKAAKQKVALLVLDGEQHIRGGCNTAILIDVCLCVYVDMWSQEHADPFDCLDFSTDSKFLVCVPSTIHIAVCSLLACFS